MKQQISIFIKSMAVNILAMGMLACGMDGVTEISMVNATALPYVITNSGSYRLTENLLLTNASTDGISVRANNVILDLNGFLIRGCASAGTGILQSNGFHSLTVRNGSIVSFSSGHAVQALGDNNGLENLSAISNEYGLLVGHNSRISSCIGIGNERDAFVVGDDGVVENSLALRSDGYAMVAGRHCVVDACAAFDNYGGIQAGPACVLTRCLAISNGAYSAAFNLQTGGVMKACGAFYNSAQGCLAAGDVIMEGCLSSYNHVGLYMGQGGVIQDCAAGDNSTYGIQAGSATRIQHCSTYDNGVSGVYVSNDCIVAGNNCNLNANAGVETTGRGNRIEANHTRENEYGFQIRQGGNILIRNSSYLNYNVNDIAGGNVTSRWYVLIALTDESWANFGR